MRISNRENDVYALVAAGEITIDDSGRCWRVGYRQADRWTKATRLIACSRRRAENKAGRYLQVRAMIDGVRWHALAHRLVWRHFFGPIPEGSTVRHKDGDSTDNHPSNLYLVTKGAE